jgi:hypothetical protein
MAPYYGQANVVPVLRGENAIPSQKAIGEALRIRFIRIGGNRISGTLEPYTDPDCGCTVTTTFIGSFAKTDKIEGTYTTVGNGLFHPAKGKWSVTRQAIATSKE